LILSNEYPISRFIEEAKSLGFIAVGFSRPGRPLFFDEFCSWINEGKHGEMGWLERNLELRANPEGLLDGCRTVISLAYPYSRRKPCTPDGFTAARYAEPRKSDYHGRLRKITRNLARSIHERFPESRMRICVDSAPMLERSFAYASGMGFIGKNNMLIVPGYGSYFFLVEILTTALLPFQEAVPIENQCSSCTKCIDACPNGALEKDFSLNASRCLSYLSIEYRHTVNSHTGRIMGNCFFGCDVCQEVCPFNEEALSMELSLPPTDEILEMDEEGFKVKFGETAFAHAGLEKLKSNIRAARSSTVEEISS
jgi:epoxyqueuosine reductase